MKEFSPCAFCKFKDTEVIGGLIGPMVRHKCGDKPQRPLEPGTACSKRKEKVVFEKNSQTSG
jgi:hypothetical protein